MGMYNDYNNYRYTGYTANNGNNNGNDGHNGYNRKKRRSGTAVFAVVMAAVLLCAGIFFYIRVTGQFYELSRRIESYGSAVDDYRTRLDALTTDIAGIFGLSGDLADGLAADVNYLRDSLERVSNSPVFADTNNSRSISIVDTAARMGPSIIGVRVHVPAQNTNSFLRATRARQSEGSGIILTDDGYIVTNYHVIALYNRYSDAVMSVMLSDGSEYIAEFVGGDELNDLAVIKINGIGLPYAVLGVSGDMRVGDFVIAIGNPLGMYLSGSVTFGIVSGLNRTINADNVAESLIQTDAAINPGNSGGALLNLHGEVIGINTLKVSQSGGGVNVEGIGFAIPIDHAKPLIESIIQYGYVKGRATIGFSGSGISSSMASIYRVPRGVLVESVYPGAGAETVGIRVGDIITRVNGANVSGMNDIARIIRRQEVGDTVTVVLWRNGTFFEARIVLTEQR